MSKAKKTRTKDRTSEATDYFDALDVAFGLVDIFPPCTKPKASTEEIETIADQVAFTSTKHPDGWFSKKRSLTILRGQIGHLSHTDMLLAGRRAVEKMIESIKTLEGEIQSVEDETRALDEACPH